MLITIHSAPPLKNLRSFWKGTIRSHVIVWRRHSKQPRRARILASGALAAANQPYWFCTCIILPSLSRDWCAIVHRKSSFCVFLSHNICRRGLVTRCSSVFTDGKILHRFPKEEKQDNFGFQVNNTAAALANITAQRPVAPLHVVAYAIMSWWVCILLWRLPEFTRNSSSKKHTTESRSDSKDAIAQP